MKAMTNLSYKVTAFVFLGVTIGSLMNIQKTQAATLTVDFNSTGGTILDQNGLGTGFTDRLAGTGGAIPNNNPNLNLDTNNGILQFTTTTSDINGQTNMPTMNAIGIRLSNLGFTGNQDFSVSGTFSGFPTSNVNFDQFGLYVGTSSSQNIRNGFLNSGIRRVFAVNNNGGNDSGIALLNLSPSETTLNTTISRTDAVWNIDINGSNLNIVQPTFLNNQADLFVGIYGSNTAAGNEFTFNVENFEASVVPEPLSIMGTSTAFLLGVLFKKRKNSDSIND